MKNKLIKNTIVGMCLCGSLGVLAGCNEKPPETPEPPETPVTTPSEQQSTKYNLVFNFNDGSTPNETKEINKTDINNRSTWPTLPDKNGYSGEWIKSAQNGDTITLVPSYGDGSQEAPYLISTAEQFQKIVVASKEVVTTLFSKSHASDSSITEENAYRKVENYNTVMAVYLKDSITPNWSWQCISMTEQNKLHYRLINNIDINEFTETVSGGTISLDLDGGQYDLDGNLIDCYALDNMSSTKISGSYIFSNIVNSHIKNLEFKVGERCVGFAQCARDGNTTLENINATTIEGVTTITKGNNSSVFIGHVLTGCNFEMINCNNYANYSITSGKYSGVFIGGYGYYGTNVSFINCVNYGDVISAGTAGLFFGNGAYRPTNVTIKNCANNGLIVSDSRTHILVCLVDSSIFGTNKYTEDIAKSYDETVEGEFTQNGEIIRMSSTSIASVSGNDLTITNTNSNLTAGKYVITLSRSTFSTEHQYTTNRFYLPVHTAVVDGTTNTITFENIFYNMIDKEAYLNFGNTLPEGEWNSIENSEYSWIKDDTTKSYILDTKCEYMVKNTDKMMFSIAVFNNENELIETIVLNGLSLES